MAQRPITRFSRFDRATDEVRLRIIARSGGEVASGKTFWWLGAPAPIVVLTMDQGLEGVIEPFAREKEIYVASYNLGLLPREEGDDTPTVFSQEQAIEVRNKYVLDFEDAIRQGARSVIQDRETDFWHVCSYAEFGDPKSGNPKDWDALKNVQRRMIAMAIANGINLGIIEGMKNEWVPSINPQTGRKGIAQTGRRVCAGHDDVDPLTHHNLLHTRRDAAGEPSVYSITPTKAHGVNAPFLQGQELEDTSFVQYAMMAFPGSTEEDWQ